MAVYHSCTDLAFLFLVALLMILEALQVTALLRKDEIVLEGQQNLGALITCKIFIKTDDLFLKTAAGRLEIPLGCIDCGSLGGFSTLGSRFSTIDAPGISGLQIVTLMIIALDRPCDCAQLLLESFGLFVGELTTISEPIVDFDQVPPELTGTPVQIINLP